MRVRGGKKRRARRARAAAIAVVVRRLRAELAEARRSAEEARRLCAQADAASQAKSAFLANMSHELRTPLNSILGFAQLMERDRSLTEQQRENLLIIGKSGEHLLGLINDILEMAKIEAGRVTLSERTFDLHAMLARIEEMFAVEARRKGLALVIDRAPDVPRHLRCDEGRLRQVLINLIGNALKFTSEGSVSLWVKVAPDAGGARVRLCFEVADTGPGIAPDELATLFQAFSQARGGREAQEGTGLGLAISREFVRLMGGDIRVEIGGGARFLFDVQAELPQPEQIPGAPEHRTVVGLAPGQPSIRALVVDDRWDDRHVLMKLLEAVGIEVRGATNGLGAIAQFEAWAPHVIFMDMRMPLLDGYEATRRIKATPEGARTIILGMTASAFEHNRALVLGVGCDDFLRKPYRDIEVFDMLSRHLGTVFVHDDAAPLSANAAPDADLAAAMAALPRASREDLRQAATRLDLKAVQAVIEQIRGRDQALASALWDLARAYRFDRVLAAAGPAEAGS